MSERLEEFLPKKHRFDTTVQEFFCLLDEQIETISKDVDDILHPGQELDRDVVLFWELAGRLVSALANVEHEDSEKVQIVMYRAMMFALQIVNEIKPAPITSLAIGEYVHDDMWDDERLKEDTGMYLSTSPQLDALLGKYMPEIDQYSHYNHYAEIAAALLLMLAEREVAKAYIVASLDATG